MRINHNSLFIDVYDNNKNTDGLKRYALRRPNKQNICICICFLPTEYMYLFSSNRIYVSVSVIFQQNICIWFLPTEYMYLVSSNPIPFFFEDSY